jgi:hypothetical protein
MTFEEIQNWCRANRVKVRGIYRGKEIFIRGNGAPLPTDLPRLSEIFHWDLGIDDKHYPTSPSDMERLVAGKMTLDLFKSISRVG